MSTAGWVEAWTISQPAVAVRATPDAEASAAEQRAQAEARGRQVDWLRRGPVQTGLAAGGTPRRWRPRGAGAGVVRSSRWSAAATSAGRWATTTTAAAAAELDQRVGDDLLGELVEVGGRLVEEHPGPVGDDDPGQGEPGALAGGQRGTVLAEPAVEPVGQCPDTLLERHPAQRLPQLVVGGASGRPRRRLSAMVPATKCGRCGSQATCALPLGAADRSPVRR